jgi:hypothetical protein
MNTHIVYEKLIKAFGELEVDHKAVLGIIKKVAKTLKQFYSEIRETDNINNDKNCGNGELQESDYDDNSATISRNSAQQ